jgi:alpha-glucoside transport system permease protein
VADHSSVVLASTASDAGSALWHVVLAVGGFLAVLLVIFVVIGRVTGRLQRPLTIFFLLGPAVVLAVVGLVVPAINAIILSLTNTTQSDQKFKLVNGKLVANSAKFVGLKNYKFAFTDSDSRATLIHTLFWIIVVPTVSVFVGLLLALLLDQMTRTALVKTLIFLPTAISFVGATLIWRLVYDYKDPSQGQTGLLSQIMISFGWKHPPNWILDSPLNSFLLMIILVWIEVGFAMVVLGAALKAIPEEIIEAAKMDGATGLRLFRTVQIPMIRNTLIVVTTTIIIATLKIFDIVITATNGNYNTDVLARRVYDDLFVTDQVGRGAALAVILFICVLPLVIYNVVQLVRQRAQ